MSKIRLYGDTSGFVELAAPDVAPDAQWTVANTAAGYLYAGTVYFTSNGTFSKADPLGTGDIGLKAVRVRLVGGGGGGGSAATTGSGENALGGGGGSAGYTEALFSATSLSSSESVTVGSGGAGGVAGVSAAVAGASSSFSTALARGGGAAGAGTATAIPFAAATAGAAAAIGVGDFLVPGQSGNRVYGFANAPIVLALGGSSVLGRSAGLLASSFGANGASPEAVSYGAGGGGGGNAQSQATARTGGAGAAGVVIVDCFV